VFLLEPYEMKFSYMALRGGLGLVTYLNKVYDWFEERLEIQAIAESLPGKKPPARGWRPSRGISGDPSPPTACAASSSSPSTRGST